MSVVIAQDTSALTVYLSANEDLNCERDGDRRGDDPEQMGGWSGASAFSSWLEVAHERNELP
jgi:hypothetical protein